MKVIKKLLSKVGLLPLAYSILFHYYRRKAYKQRFRQYRENIRTYRHVEHNQSEKLILFQLRNHNFSINCYPLMHILNDLGYTIRLNVNRRFVSRCFFGSANIYKLKRFKLSHSNRIPAETIMIFTDNPTKLKTNDKAIIHLKAIDGNISENSFFPYIMHPNLYAENLHKELPKFCTTERTMKIFFSGNNIKEIYDNSIFKTKYNVMTRHEITTILHECFDSEYLKFFKDKKELDEVLLKKDFENKIFFNDFSISYTRIYQSDWLLYLAKSDFFISAPGIIMPLCHNIIEAMATGTIPIVQYNNMLKPPLINGTNCLTFTDKESFIAALNKALIMSETEIGEMRKNVIDYYNQHLDPQLKLQELISNSTIGTKEIFMNVENII